MLWASFNTSHVVVYLRSATYIQCARIVSIHLMLLFIDDIESINFAGYMFQYISCCCLSRTFHKNGRKIIMFQYISCCCLSYSFCYVLMRGRPFQYISCCCLSHYFSVKYTPLEAFQYISCCCLSVSFKQNPK